MSLNIAENNLKLVDEYKFKNPNFDKKILNKVQVVQNTHFFICTSLTKDGLMRWDFTETEKFAQKKIEKIPNFLFFSSLENLEPTIFTIFSLLSWNQMIIFDIS